MLEATRRQANELYTLFSLLSKGTVSMGDALGNVASTVPVALIQRKEHDGLRRYAIEPDLVRIDGTSIHESFPRQDFADAADILLTALTSSHTDGDLDITAVEGFLDALQIYDMEAQTDDRTTFRIALWSPEAQLIGVRINSRLCGMSPLLDGGRTANIKYEQTGVRFSGPAVNKINHTDQPDNVAEVARRILYIESQGGVLKYADVADKVFKSNLLMLDTNLPRILATMLRALHLDGITRMDQLLHVVEESNPLKVKDELVQKHGIYNYKVRQLLLACAWGMRPARMFNGRASAIDACLITNEKGESLLFTHADEQTFSDYLLMHTRLEKSLPDADKYGYLERENGKYYLKLNLKIGWRK